MLTTETTASGAVEISEKSSGLRIGVWVCAKSVLHNFDTVRYAPRSVSRVFAPEVALTELYSDRRAPSTGGSAWRTPPSFPPGPNQNKSHHRFYIDLDVSILLSVRF